VTADYPFKLGDQQTVPSETLTNRLELNITPGNCVRNWRLWRKQER